MFYPFLGLGLKGLRRSDHIYLLKIVTLTYPQIWGGIPLSAGDFGAGAQKDNRELGRTIFRYKHVWMVWGR